MKRAFHCALGLSALLAPARAVADEAADTAAARAYGQDGVMLADQGKCPQAIEKLVLAEALRHAPTTAARLGECEIDVGRLVAGTERLQRLLREPLPPGAPAVFEAAYARAEKALAAALPKIAALRVTVRAPKDAKVVVTVDGEPVPQVLLDNDRPADPGTHRVQASARGFFSSTAQVALKDAETKTVSLTLRPDPNAPPEPPPSPPGAPGASGASDGGGSAATTLGYAGLGVGVVGVLVGAVSAGFVATKASKLRDNCDDRRCPPGEQGTLDQAKNWSTVSTVGFVAGGVGLAGGALLLLLDGGGGRPPAAGALRPAVGLSSLGLSYRF